MWIMIAGPYRAGGGAADPMIRAANLRVLNEAAVALHRAGHVPVIGVNMALPMIEAAGGSDAAYDELMAPVSLALVDRCDACLRVSGPSTGADDEVRRFEAAWIVTLSNKEENIGAGLASLNNQDISWICSIITGHPP